MREDDLLQDRLTRIKRAVALEKPDRIPVVLEYAGFAAYLTNTPMAAFLSSPAKTLETMIRAYHLVGDADAINYGSFWVYGLCYGFMSKVKVPGVDLPDNDMWQVWETDLMKLADYDRILDLGWPEFFENFMKKRVLNDAPPELLPPNWKTIDARGEWAANGVPVLSGGDVTTPIELLCGSRSLVEFASDMYEIPNKIEAVMDLMVPHLATATIRRAKKHGYPAVWVGGWRSAPSMLSPAMWNRFAWPYFSRLVREVVDSGLIAILHLDSNWARELDRFKELPRGKCIMSLDGETDILKAKKILGDHMCLMGDVSASMLCFDTPERVYNYSTELIRALGPEGFILQSGCDIPPNAKLENVQAMVAAAHGAE